MSKRISPARTPRACCPQLEGALPAAFFRALCDPSRIGIFARLAERCGPCSVSEVAAGCSVDLSVVSRHLGVLRDAGILEADKRGKAVFYSIRADAVVRTLRAIADAIETCCATGTGTRPLRARRTKGTRP
jgi:DNA-binding transcriptional ArsR family regulator